MENRTNPSDATSEIIELDAIVVGAGFGGMYMTYRLREMGLSFVGIEAGGDVGGVWYWNRYPGARCDLMCIDYSYGFSKEIQEEWSWSEQFAAQPEILAYANFVADKLDLRPHYHFNTRVVRSVWHEDRKRWLVTTDDGRTFAAAYCIMATGPLSVPKDPEFPGLDSFGGEIYRAARWPQDKVDFNGKRVGVVGTGSTGIQIVPVVAQEADELYVFQRTPSFSMPMRNQAISPEYMAEIKRHYPGLRAAAKMSALGGVRPQITRPFFSLPQNQRRALMEDSWARGGHALLGTFADIMTNEEANEELADFVRDKINEIVEDAETAEALKPRGYPIFARRPCLDTNYYETYNMDHVHLVNCLKDPIERVTKSGMKTRNKEIDLDALILATGYDGLTGALLAFEVVGREGVQLSDKWSHGAESYLGMMISGFPNLFMICGPNGPAALANIVTLDEQNVGWICNAIAHMRENQITAMNATESAEQEWMENVKELAQRTLLSKASTWYVGANVDGKARGLTMYTGGFFNYSNACADVENNDYKGFEFDRLEALAAE